MIVIIIVIIVIIIVIITLILKISGQKLTVMVALFCHGETVQLFS